jgi:hypothetical protein
VSPVQLLSTVETNEEQEMRMPAETEFRVGDQIEIRRGREIPEQFRRLRGEVTAITSEGTVKVALANPVAWSNYARPIHYNPTERRWWRPEELRLVSRRLRIAPGARVVVSNPAYTTPEGRGGVDSRFYGATCVVESQSITPGVWRVRLNHDMNVIHEAYLTVIEESPHTHFTVGDLVMVASPAYSMLTRDPYYRVRPFEGQLGTIASALNREGQYVVAGEDGVSQKWIHCSFLTPYVDEAEPLFSVGDAVRVGDNPRSLPGGRGERQGRGGHDAMVVRMVSPTRPEVLDLVTGSVCTVYQEYLSAREVPEFNVGDRVQVGRTGVGPIRNGQVDYAPNAVSSAVGVVESVNPGAVTVKVGERSHLLHPSCLSPISEEEWASRLFAGDRVRVHDDATEYTNHGSPADGRIRGRVGVINSLDNEVPSRYIYVCDPATAETFIVSPRGVTKFVSTVESGCGICLQESDDLVALTADRRKRHCPDCRFECAGCSTQWSKHSMAGGRIYEGAWYCSGCVTACGNCATYAPTTDMITGIPGTFGAYCPSCVSTCVDCETQFVSRSSGRCRDCRSSVGQSALGSWRHTRPTMWLGGPVREKGGYYIGFEHEVSARDDFSLRPLKAWAEANLGSPDALDPKPDSSVRGFEIATQPMTPAFFESVDWESYMEMVNQTYPVHGNVESEEHGLHVHIGRQAFRREKIVKVDHHGCPLVKPRKVMVTDAGMLAAFTYLLTRGHGHLERIGRRVNTRWAPAVPEPVKAAIVHPSSEIRSKQWQKITGSQRVSIPRGAVNLTNTSTIEIRTAASTRSADDLRAAVRVVYLAAEYVRHLRNEGTLAPPALKWEQFTEWVGQVMPGAYASIAGVENPGLAVTGVASSLMEAFVTDESRAASESGTVNMVNEIRSTGPSAPTGFAIGTRVLIGDPAYLTPDEDDDDGYVDEDFYGRVGTIMSQAGLGTWEVAVRGRGTQSIHQNWLTVREGVGANPF